MARYRQLSPGHFVEVGFASHIFPVPPQIYGPAVRDNIVVSCADVVMVRLDRRILFARRSIEPLKGQYWVIGGKRNPGESPVETAQRHCRRDTQLDLRSDRFIQVGIYSTAFAVRNEPPFENGSHTDNWTFAVELNSEEAARIKLDPREYEGEDAWCWFQEAEIRQAVEEGSMHPELELVVDDLKRLKII